MELFLIWKIKKIMKTPEHHQAVMPYLIVKTAKKFLDFTETVFGAKLTYSEQREEGTAIRHAEIQIGGSTIMFADATEQFSPQTASLFIYVPDADIAYQKALDHGAVSVMPLLDKDYGRTCGVKDTCGNTWWITAVK